MRADLNLIKEGELRLAQEDNLGEAPEALHGEELRVNEGELQILCLHHGNEHSRLAVILRLLRQGNEGQMSTQNRSLEVVQSWPRRWG